MRLISQKNLRSLIRSVPVLVMRNQIIPIHYPLLPRPFPPLLFYYHAETFLPQSHPPKNQVNCLFQRTQPNFTVRLQS